MYLRTVHTDLHLPTLYAFIRNNPLGILTTSLPSPNFHTIQSSHIPWVLDAPSEDEEATSSSSLTRSKGRLRGHIARANPQAKALIEAACSSSSSRNSSNGQAAPSNTTLPQEIMILFNGPAHHYVTPKFYVATKPATGKVAPTWNYSAVQVYGTATIHFDASLPATETFLAAQLDDLSRQSEERVFGFTGTGGAPRAWSVAEAPASYVSALKKGIVGIEIAIAEIAGKFKMSQELTEGDREGVIEGFARLGTDDGDEISKTVRERWG
ncbi:hypothetical protein LZ554_008407 [Drepanopeziza brunnea f. sp. 'monogermtubi']|nr:hypothetical protein LZ554_008407 [Drepanopeziza brunnea f. sp. 'monogermtubi']